MIETVQAYIQSINERKHVLTLIEDTVLTIEFIVKDEMISLSLKKGEVCTSEQLCNAENKFSIHGEKESVKALISGREKFRTLLMNGDLQCSAPFRTILLLESFFYLGKTEKKMAKIS
ncbi:MAG: SCP2 sterol-binding domain-containing protein [Bacillota bacterium]|nr:SCP2 sterol-binding domain-containing protein [Bacillota bacterium]